MTIQINGTTGISGVDGSATTPALQGTDSNTGIHFPAADTVAIDTGGSERLRVNSSGNVGIGTTSPGETLSVATSNPGASATVARLQNTGTTSGTEARLLLSTSTSTGGTVSSGISCIATDAVGNTALALGSGTAGSYSEKARIDSSGRLLVGTSTARNDFYNQTGTGALVQLEGSGSSSTNYILQSWIANHNSATVTPHLVIGKSRGSTNGAVTVVQSGDSLGHIDWHGADGTDMVPAASIECVVDGTPGSNDMPGRLVFSTTADGASSPTERMRIASGGGIFAYNLTGSASAGSTLKLISNEIIRDTSSIQFKKDVEDIEEGYAANLLDNARPVWFRAKDDKQNPEHSYWGFIAEELAEVEPRLCVFEDGAPFSVDYGKFSPLLLKLIQMQNEKIKSLETRLAALEGA
jgi:hypothetical protein